MVLLFPDPDTFHLVLTGGYLPPEVLAAPTTVGFAPDGGVSVEAAGKLPKKTATELTRLGVTAVKRHPGPAETLSCWPQILPAARDPEPPRLASQAPVLFELGHADDLPVIVKEMLRLGNDRQSVRWLAAEDGSADRVLLRVVGPPYYTLLRAIDPSAGGSAGPVRAYVEQAPRVWVQVGYTHPLAPQVKLADGQLLLIRPPRGWSYVPDEPFRDVYDALDFDLPATHVEWTESPAQGRLSVPLRLVAGNAADAAELWVLRGDAAGRLDGFVRDADERVVQRLRFAVADDPAGGTVVVLRAATSKAALPVLPIPGAVGFKPSHKLPNLYVPAGTRLQPALRRDAVRKLLAPDADHLVWLAPGADDGAYTPETIPENAFRPLADWVDYVIEKNHAPLAEWVGASRFAFDQFVCADAPTPPADPGDRDKGKRRPAPAPRPGKARPGAEADPAPDGGTVMAAPEAFNAPPPSPKAPGEWEVRRKELEARFLAVDGPLDHPDRQALWPDLAAANAGLGDTSEAAVCWLNALWGTDDPPPAWVDAWYRTEFPMPPTPAEFDHRATAATPTAGEARQFAAMLVWLATQPKPPTWFVGRLAAAQRYLDAHGRTMPVRAAWLAATRLAASAGSDPLGLARARDRLLLQLLEGGVNPETDLPAFLRFAGLEDSDRVRLIRAKARDLHRDVRTWADAGLSLPAQSSPWSDDKATLGYVDLFFAFALAKLGDSDAARGLVGTARQALGKFDPATTRAVAADFLFKAFAYRVDQAVAGKPHAGRLPPDLLDELAGIHALAGGAANNANGEAYYAITRMQEQSRLLEPHERREPNAEYLGHGDPLKKALAALESVRDTAALARSVRELVHNGADGKPTAATRFEVLHRTLPLVARCGEQLAAELVGLLPDALRAVAAVKPEPADAVKKQGQALESALFLAAHFDRREQVRELVDQFADLLRAKPDAQRYELAGVVSAQCLRSLRKLGMRDETDRLLGRMRDVILGGRTAADLKAAYRGRAGAKPAAGKGDLWAKALQGLLNLAGGWLTNRQADDATPVLDDARAELLGPKTLEPEGYTALARAYVGALGHAPVDVALPRLAELFRDANPGRVTNAYTTSKCYSRFHLNLVESTVLALVGDDASLAAVGKRWLEEDELLVRRRVHRDMRRALDRGGL